MKKQVELTTYHLNDQRIKISEKDKQEIISLNGHITAIKCAKLYNCSRQSIYLLWNEEYKEKKRLYALKNGTNPGTKEQWQKNNKKQLEIKELKNKGLM